jgi:hypothetical protein
MAPAAGVIILYFVLTKQLSELRYMMLAAPGLAALCGIGILRIYQINARMGVLAWCASLAFLLSVANWGYASSYYQGKTIYRDFSTLLQQHQHDSNLVIAGTGPLPGNTAALFYELPPDTNVVVLRPDTNVEAILATSARYDHVWLVRIRELTRGVEDKLAESLQRSRKNTEIFYQIEHFE